jgi:hypothetical protein
MMLQRIQDSVHCGPWQLERTGEILNGSATLAVLQQIKDVHHPIDDWNAVLQAFVRLSLARHESPKIVPVDGRIDDLSSKTRR